jgi:hypothetical protein
MGILKMVDYKSGSHNVYKERYTNPTLWQKEFDADIRLWLKFNVDRYESVILSKEHLTVDMKSIKWDNLRSLNIPAIKEAIDICHAKGWHLIMIGMKKSLPNSLLISMSGVIQRPSIGSCKASPSLSPMKCLLRFLALVRKILAALRLMVE